jgi:hypothetical protein
LDCSRSGSHGEIFDLLDTHAGDFVSAGLLWATRASCILAAASLVIQGEEGHQLPPVLVVTMKVWAWTALELFHLPDCLQAIQLMNGCIASMPLTEEEKAKVQSEIQELDIALGCYFYQSPGKRSP